jgi:N-acetylmuramoyl-L-alanine amidase
MRWSRAGLSGLAIVALCWAMSISGAAPEQQLTVYTAQTSYSLPVLDRAGKSYIAVAQFLSPMGASSPRLKGKEWQLELNKNEVALTEDKDQAVIGGHQIGLGGKVLVEQGQVLVPLDAALPLLKQLLDSAIYFHQPSRRIFVGNGFTRFRAESKKNQGLASLVLTFNRPVNPVTGHDQNRTILTFRLDPLVSDVGTQQFGDGPIQSLTFIEENGTASITVTGNASLQVIRSEDGKTITLQPETPAVTASSAPQSVPAAVEGQQHPRDFFVMIDPSHGGNDKGAILDGKLAEKDITLRLAKELRKELEERGIAARLLRDTDIDVELERRAEITNEQHAGVYIAIHAGHPGRGVRVYTPLLANPEQPVAGRFLPWESAQSGALARSQTAAQAVAGELRKKGLTVASVVMPLRPLNNIMVPAFAVELAPDSDDSPSFENQKRHNALAVAIASGIAQTRSQMGARP